MSVVKVQHQSDVRVFMETSTPCKEIPHGIFYIRLYQVDPFRDADRENVINLDLSEWEQMKKIVEDEIKNWENKVNGK